MPGKGSFAGITAGLALALGAGTAQAQVAVYSSVSLKGIDAPAGRSILNAERLALQQAGGKVGDLTVRLVAMNDATSASGTYDPTLCSRNPLRAAEDPQTVVYLGDFATRCDTISAPISNELGLAQISPGGTLAALTRSGSQYRVKSARTYLRVIGGDHLQSDAIVRDLRRRGVRRIFIVGNQDPSGRYIAATVRTRARSAGLRVVGRVTVSGGLNAAGLAARIRRSGAQGLVVGGTASRGGPGLLNSVARTAPGVRIVANAALGSRSFGRKLSGAARARTTVMVPAVDPRRLGSRGRSFASAYRSRFNQSPDRYAIYGYEAMRLALDAIRRAGPEATNREIVRKRLFSTRGRNSALGRFSIDRNGDITKGVFGAYRFGSSGALRLSRVVRVG